MKKIICFFLSIMLLFLFCSCSTNQDTEHSVRFYYRSAETQYNSEDGVISSEYRDAGSNWNNFPKLISQYINGPVDDSLVSPFPKGLKLVEWDISRNIVAVTLSEHLANQSGVELMLSCACLTKTVLELTGIPVIEIRSKDNLLNGKEALTFSIESISYMDPYFANTTVPAK